LKFIGTPQGDGSVNTARIFVPPDAACIAQVPALPQGGE
jgi:hypothetical protein